MEEHFLALVIAASGIAPLTSGIVEVIKDNTAIEGLTVIAVAIIVAMSMLGLIAGVFELPMAESLLLGFITGWASVGAFNGVEQVKEKIDK